MANPGDPTTRGAPATSRLLGEEWAAQTAGTIERVVGSVRDRTAVPLERLARLLVYALLAAVLGVAAAVLMAILLVRVLDVAIPGGVWSAHLITGGIFVAAGLFLWSRRSAPPARSPR
jgi:hypothetical protein